MSDCHFFIARFEYPPNVADLHRWLVVDTESRENESVSEKNGSDFMDFVLKEDSRNWLSEGQERSFLNMEVDWTLLPLCSLSPFLSK